MGTNQVLRRIAADNAVEKICKEAYRESEMLKENGEKLTKSTEFQPFFLKHVISLEDAPVSLDTFMNFDPTVRTTAGFYTLKYIPISMRQYKNKAYVIGQDMIRMRVLVSGYKHWKLLSHSIPELKWIQRWCPMLTGELFGLAKRHPGMSFYFSPDWVAYANVICKKAAEMGIDISNKAFVTYAAPEETVAEINKTHFLAPIRNFDDVRGIVEDAGRQFTAEEEDE